MNDVHIYQLLHPGSDGWPSFQGPVRTDDHEVVEKRRDEKVSGQFFLYGPPHGSAHALFRDVFDKVAHLAINYFPLHDH